MTPVTAVNLTEHSHPRFATSPVLDELLPGLSGLNLPYTVAERIEQSEDSIFDQLVTALTGEED